MGLRPGSRRERRASFICPRAPTPSQYRLGYRSQRETANDRALGRAFKLRRRLGSSDGIGNDIAKPKGMRWRTFNRYMARLDQAEIVDGHTALLIQRLGLWRNG